MNWIRRGLVLLVLFLLARPRVMPVDVLFTIGPETTFLTEPVDAAGFVDYAAGLNARLSAGIRPEENAVALLCRVYGPRPEGQRLDPEFYGLLGIEEPPEEGDYLVEFAQFRRKEMKPDEDPGPEPDLEKLAQLPWRSWNDPAAARWLQAMAGPLDRAIQASRLPRYYHPMIPRWNEYGTSGLFTCNVGSVQKMRELNQALHLRAMLHLGEGRPKEAWEDLMACGRLARLTTHGSTLVELIVGLFLEPNIAGGIVVYLEKCRPDRKTVEDLRRQVRSWPRRKKGWEVIDLGDRCAVLEACLLTQRYGPDYLQLITKPDTRMARVGSVQGVAWDPALRKVNVCFDRIREGMKEPDYFRRRDLLTTLDAEIVDGRVKLKQSDPLSGVFGFLAYPEQRGARIGDIMMLLVPSFRRVQATEDTVEQVERNLDAAFALATYHAEHGRYPEDLAKLAPEFLREVPLDLFTGQPLRYRREGPGYLLYSLGCNEQDDEGLGREDGPRTDDIVVRVPAVFRK